MKSVMLAPRDAIEDVIATVGLKFPLDGSYKIDGYRAAFRNDDVLTRSMKKYKNEFMQAHFGRDYNLHGLDGEFTVGAPNIPETFDNCSVMRRIKGEPEATLYVFDMWNIPDVRYGDRYEWLQKRFDNKGDLGALPDVRLLEQRRLRNQDDMDEMENEALLMGYEGLMIRSPDGKYKYGRCTAHEGIIYKVKRFDYGEAQIVGWEELMHNENEAFTAENGATRRSFAKDGLVPGGVLGAWIVQDLITGEEFKIGTGFTAKQRADMWATREAWLGHIVRYKHFPKGRKDAPRIPVWGGTRDRDDM